MKKKNIKIKFHQKVICRRWLFIFQKSDGQVFFIFCFHKIPPMWGEKKNKNTFKVIKFCQKVICRRCLFFQKSGRQVTFFISLIGFHKIPPMWDEKYKYFKNNYISPKSHLQKVAIYFSEK